MAKNKTKNTEKYIKRKRGVLSHEEQEYIRLYRDSMSVEKIAEHLNRNVKTVKKHIASIPEKEVAESQDDWIARLHRDKSWPSIKNQLIGNEIGRFEELWSGYMDQFGKNADIMASDKLMVGNLIVSQIMADRSSKKQAMMESRIYTIESDIQREMARSDEEKDHGLLRDLRSELSNLYTSVNSLSKDYREFQDRIDKILKQLKATREQRYKEWQEVSTNIVDLIKTLSEKQERIREGRLAEKVKIASEKIADEWNEVEKFADGEFDKVYLSPEGEIDDEKREKLAKRKIDDNNTAPLSEDLSNN